MKTKKQFLGRLMAPALLGTMLMLLTACPSNKTTPTYVDLGRIPEQYLATVPYRDGDVFRMQHETSKVIIDFEVSRYRCKETGTDYRSMKYKPTPNYIYEYELDQTVCKPKYPIFDINITFSNEYMAFEEEQGYNPAYDQPVAKTAQIYAVGSVSIPFFGEDHSGYEVLDSLEINGRYYHEVFKLKSDYYYNEGKEVIHAETFFYNYEKGILGILMSNGERFELYED